MNLPQPGSVLPCTEHASSRHLYQSDFALWLKAQATLLQERNFDSLDLDNLVEEIDAVARSLHRELKSGLEVVLVHLLKRKFQPGHDSHNWLGTLNEQRSQIELLLEENPSLKQHVDEYAEQGYRRAAKRAASETGLPPSTFPSSNPFSEAQLLDLDYLP